MENVINLIWYFAMIAVEIHLVHVRPFRRCVFCTENYTEISVSGTAAWRNVQLDLVFLFILPDLSGLYTDERPWRWQNSYRLWQYIWWKVQGRSCHNFWDGMYFFIYFFVICWPHLLRVTLGTAQTKIVRVLSFFPCKTDSTKRLTNLIINVIFCKRNIGLSSCG